MANGNEPWNRGEKACSYLWTCLSESRIISLLRPDQVRARHNMNLWDVFFIELVHKFALAAIRSCIYTKASYCSIVQKLVKQVIVTRAFFVRVLQQYNCEWARFGEDRGWLIDRKQAVMILVWYSLYWLGLFSFERGCCLGSRRLTLCELMELDERGEINDEKTIQSNPGVIRT